MATAARVLEVLSSYRFRYGKELELQDGIADALGRRGLAFEREVRLAPGDIVDFLVAGGIALEVKTKGSPPEIARQLMRYAGSSRVSALVLVSRKSQHARRFPAELGGKPLQVVTLEASAL